MKAINDDIQNTVFSYIPNTAETSFYGMVETLKRILNKTKTEQFCNGQRLIGRESYQILSQHQELKKSLLRM